MPKPKSIYRRLPGRGTTLTYYAHLYQGPDHLLQAASTGYSETYKRFYFRDIQAIIIRRTNWWLLWMAIWLLPALGFATGAMMAGDDAVPVLWSITAVFVIGFIIHTLLGPSCVCHVQTAVQTEKLPSLKRLRKARKILNRLRPLIEGVQGKLSAEELVTRRREGGRAEASSPPGPVLESAASGTAPPVTLEDAPPAPSPDNPSTGTT